MWMKVHQIQNIIITAIKFSNCSISNHSIHFKNSAKDIKKADAVSYCAVEHKDCR